MSFKSFSSAQAAPTKDRPKDKGALTNETPPDKAPDKGAPSTKK